VNYGTAIKALMAGFAISGVRETVQEIFQYAYSTTDAG
jgi:hypothetical protein